MRITSLFILSILIFANSTFANLPKDDKKKTDEAGAVGITPAFIEGIVYALPRTGLTINVKTEQTDFHTGPYAKYAEKYLGIKNVKTANEQKWEIVSIEIEPFTEADPEAIFKTNSIDAISIAQLSTGIISGIQNEKTENSSFTIEGSDNLVKESSASSVFNDLSSDNYYEINVNPTNGQEIINFKSQEIKAREAADYLMRLRKKRAYTILDASDVVPEDGRGYEAFIKEAQRLEIEYVALFAGKQIQTKHQFSFTYIPGSSEVKNELLFRFSEDKGILPKSDISGKPVFISLSKEKEALKSAEQLKRSNNPNAGESGIYYRIPVSADISISDGINQLYYGRALLPQFGVLAPLPENLLKGDHSIQFNTETGTIKNIISRD